MKRLTYELGHKGSGSYEPMQNKDMPINNYIACVNKLGQLENLEEEIGCPLDVIIKVLIDNKTILVQNPITKSIQEIPNPYSFYVPKKHAFDIGCDNFEDTYYKSHIWNTGGAFFYLKDYKKTWWLRKDQCE